ncbi:hypothetical protein RJI84_00300 [Buchnera aphidicola (Chaitoregma tattakana)]|uniref:hypothetical protein n=1 Tax=Buchnera aphidicola TaxID=9 RepID=UPI0031B814F7
MKKKIKLVNLLILLKKIKMNIFYKKFLNTLSLKKRNKLDLNILSKYKNVYFRKYDKQVAYGMSVLETKIFNNFLCFLKHGFLQKKMELDKINKKYNNIFKKFVDKEKNVNILKFFKSYLLNKVYNKTMNIIEFNNEESIQAFFLNKKNCIYTIV